MFSSVADDPYKDMTKTQESKWQQMSSKPFKKYRFSQIPKKSNKQLFGKNFFQKRLMKMFLTEK